MISRDYSSPEGYLPGGEMWFSEALKDDGLRLETPAFESLNLLIHSIIPVDKTKLCCNTPHRRSTAASLETHQLY